MKLTNDTYLILISSARFLPVPPDDTPLWRYLEFAPFMALLESASLWFARADTFSDQYELAVPAADMGAAPPARRRSRQEQEVRAVIVWPNYRDLVSSLAG